MLEILLKLLDNIKDNNKKIVESYEIDFSFKEGYLKANEESVKFIKQEIDKIKKK